MEDFVRLDSAVCSKAHRKHVLNIFSNPHFHNDCDEAHQYKYFIEWILLREIKLARIVVDCNVFDWNHFSFRKWSSLFSLVEGIEFEDDESNSLDDSTIVKVVNTCPVLEDLFFGKIIVRDSTFCKISKNVLRKIKTISFTEDGCEITDKMLGHIANNCMELTVIDLGNQLRHDVKEITFLKLIQNNANTLQLFYFDSYRIITNEVLKSISNHCLNLTDISIRVVPNIDFQFVMKILIQNPQITNFNIIGETVSDYVKSLTFNKSDNGLSFSHLSDTECQFIEYFAQINHITKSCEHIRIQCSSFVFTSNVLITIAKCNPTLHTFGVLNCVGEMTVQEVFDIMSPFCKDLKIESIKVITMVM
jgi:hypothetical protein